MKYLIPLFVIISLSSFSETIDFKGKVLDSKGTPISKVAITIKGTRLFTTTDEQGFFSIKAENNSTAIFSIPEFETKEVNIQDKYTEISLSNKNESAQIFNNGYYKIDKNNFTGAITTLDLEDSYKTAPTTLTDVMQGKIAGVEVLNQDGTPGGGVNIQIRGVNSLNSNNEPLYVIDGIPYYDAGTPYYNDENSSYHDALKFRNPIAGINPQDIESIEVLKDANSCILYGYKGANGVILIKTKKGSTNRKVQFNTSIGISTISKKIDMLNGQQYIDMLNEAEKNKYYYEGTTPKYLTYNGINNDWQDKIFRTAITNTYNFSYGEEYKGFNFLFSLGNVRQEGIIKETGFLRDNISLNLSKKYKDIFEFGSYSTYGNTTNNFSTVTINNSLDLPPTINDDNLKNYVSPSQFLQQKDELKSTNFFNSTFFKINIKSWLSFQQKFGYNYSENTRDIDSLNFSNVLNSERIYKTYDLESILSFNKTFDCHNILISLGYSYEKQDGSINYNLYGKYSSGYSHGTIDGKNKTLIGIINYALLDRYNLLFSVRNEVIDEEFLNDKYMEYAIGGSWNIAKEPLLKQFYNFDELTFKINYGKTINPYSTPYHKSLLMYDNGLKMENITQLDASINLSILKRISLNVELYLKKTENLYQIYNISSSSTFFNYIMTNGGSISNKGLSLNLNAKILEKPLKWNISGNISFDRNEINDLEVSLISGQSFYSDYELITESSKPLGNIYGYKCTGSYNNEAEVRADKRYSSENDAVIKNLVGTPRYKDFDGDGYPDRTIIGNTYPKYTFGFTNMFEYKGFELSILITGIEGNDIINTYYTQMFSYLYTIDSRNNIPKDVFNSIWRAEDLKNGKLYKANGTNPKWGKIENRSNLFSNLMVEDGSYVKLKNISVGYTFQNPIKFVNSINIYGTISNLYTWTKYSWYDPEVNSYGYNSMNRGIDASTYPSARIFTLGIKCVL